MKLVFRQYLASLRERRELDVVLPDLLSELGYNVISRPSVGTRQYGVDVAALGADEGEEKIFLFSIKQGDLTRADWDGTLQALRSSINEILDFYIPVQIPKQHEHLKIVICLCFGGDVQEAVRGNLNQFIKAHSSDRISFQEWNGDYLAGLLSEGILRQQLVNENLRNSFQKSVAMLDEPEIAFKHFSQLVMGLMSAKNETPQERLTSVRQIYICLWVIFVWARDSGNLEAPYRASELAILQGWQLINGDIGHDRKFSEDIGITFSELVDLHFQIWDEFLGNKVLPFVQFRHAVSSAVNSGCAVDVNLKLFETLGRLSLRGLWLLWGQNSADIPCVCSDGDLTRASALAAQICKLIENNRCLLSPIADEQSIDICISLIFLSMIKEWQPLAQSYCDALINNFLFTYNTHGQYPTIQGSYRELIDHPREQNDEHRESQTKGSTLIPILVIWASSLGETEYTQVLSELVNERLTHCNLQLWIPGADSEGRVYSGNLGHGMALTDIPITADGNAAIEMIATECARDEHFNALSAIKLSHWPILVMACRHYRLPPPPNLWLPLLKQVRALPEGAAVSTG
ncbi:chemotaxis protein [Pseudomonas gingeri]|uniref:chemotaxis protein n=1 Tax=Pseudomonas gingeri TaxID=117681 RepID=UPI0015A310F7|nr:chemotaxis protein [Pseudomonas gingeri]NWA28556.1 chemotaxis protein [Pseudomonas gingeri]